MSVRVDKKVNFLVQLLSDLCVKAERHWIRENMWFALYRSGNHGWVYSKGRIIKVK